MTIRTSSARDVDALLQQLESHVAVDRDAAIARLRIIGPRARDRVLALLANPAAVHEARVSALKVLDALADERSAKAVLAATSDPDAAVAQAALMALAPRLTIDTDVATLEVVAAIVADASRASEVRRSALDALSGLPASLTDPLVKRVAGQLADRPPAEDAEGAAEWLAHHPEAALGTLHDLVTRARDSERDAPTAAGRLAWRTVRAATHAALARRGSVIALYDLRELFETTREPLPLDLLVAMRTIGDMTCVESLAHAWAALPGDSWWREQVRDTAEAIVAREKATGRNGIVRRVRSKWVGFLKQERG